MLYRGDDARRLARLAAIAGEAGVPLIAVNDVLYHAPERRALQDVVTCIREHVTLEAAGRRLEANAERHLKSPAEMARLFRKAPEAVGETAALPRTLQLLARRAARHRICRRDPRRAMPRRRMRWSPSPKRALQRRFPDGVPPKVRHALDEELRLIGELGYAPFFLTVDEIVKFARSLDAADPVPGPRLGGEFGDLLLPRHHRRRSRRRSISCSSASSPPSGASRPTSTSISSTSGARR